MVANRYLLRPESEFLDEDVLLANATSATDGLTLAERGVLCFIAGVIMTQPRDKWVREDELVRLLTEVAPGTFTLAGEMAMPRA